MSANFYVYEHWRPDTNQCFYVGKGKGRRAFKLKWRGRHHGAIVEKLNAVGLGVRVIILHRKMSEIGAFEFEQERIAYWRSTGVRLANKTSGGDGVSNPDKDVREAISRKLMGNKHSLGVLRTDRQKADISARMMGNKIWLGRELTEEHRANLSKAQIGRPGRKKSSAEIEKISAALRLRVRTPETCRKLSESIKRHWEQRRARSTGSSEGTRT